MIEVLDSKLQVVAVCPTPKAATAAARLLGASWLRVSGAAWSTAAPVQTHCAECNQLRAELDAATRVRP